MKPTFVTVLTATLLVGTYSNIVAQDQAGQKPAPIILHATAHTAHFNGFQIRRSKDRSLEPEIKRKGLDLAFTEWMQRDHPYVFAAECVKHAGEMATEFKSTPHMVDFDTLLPKRADLRLSAERLGHDVAFADWLRRERPDVYREHFGIKPHQKAPPARKEEKSGGKKDSTP